ncbi:MAG: hypothetical protein CM1200mP2_06250 [Planctomycetaceae bacterium]|nr:MAG: hypothetical protein CM1200mP2_06250 [Planctomycetaceae bacterium]
MVGHLPGESVGLYNLGGDLGERTNLAASDPERVKELQAALSAWRMRWPGSDQPAGAKQKTAFPIQGPETRCAD